MAIKSMKRWLFLFFALLLFSACDGKPANCQPSSGCVLLEEGKNAKSFPTSWKKDVCPNHTDQDWVVIYNLDGDAWRNADVNDIRIYSDSSPARNKIGETAQVNEPVIPNASLCLSGRLSEEEAKSVWIWLKNSADPSRADLQGMTACVRAEALNIRSGPGQDFDSTGYLSKGDCIELVARNKESTWGMTERGWVSTYYLDYEGNLDQLPVSEGQVSSPPAEQVEGIPAGFNSVISTTGAILYKKDYGAGRQDFVQVIDLKESITKPAELFQPFSPIPLSLSAIHARTSPPPSQ
jgi:hypothetical protein